MANFISIERLRSMFSYDPNSGDIRSLSGRVIGSRDAEGYVRVRLRNGGSHYGHYRAHRLAFVIMCNRLPEGDVDHINGIRHDNRWCNLRDVDRRTNLQNQCRATASNRTSGLLGVSWDSARNLWYAQIVADGKAKNLGRFKTKEDAHEAYLTAKRQLHAGCTI